MPSIQIVVSKQAYGLIREEIDNFCVIRLPAVWLALM